MPLLHDVLNAYLAPLLKKHSVGANLSFEDLNASMEAAKAAMADSPNEFVLKRVQNLHNSQVKAYQETAKKSLEDWALKSSARVSAGLESVSKGESLDAFIARYWTWIKSKRPNWQLSDSIVEECMYKVVVKKATETYQSSPNAVEPQMQHQQQQQLKKIDSQQSQQSQPSTSEDEGEIEENAEGEEEEGEMMDEEEEEEGEEDEGEDGEVGDEEGEEDEPEEPVVATKRNSIRRKKVQNTGRQQANNKKRVVKKKTNNTKKAISGKAAAGGKKTAARGKKVTGKKGRAGSIKNA